MKRESAGPMLTTVFVDYDNIYLSLKRKSDEAAKRFAKDSGSWLQGIISGQLITPTSSYVSDGPRRIAMNRCYGNPAPRRNAHDNSTDMNSFPFVRHHFLKSGFEVIDCPPLTAQLKNSADIRIVMDIRDILTHPTFFDEFVIMSGDADFTPVLHRLRAHARRTVVYANDHTAQPYTALSDGEIRESSLIALLLNSRAAVSNQTASAGELAAPRIAQPVIDVEAARGDILAEVTNFVRTAPQAVPLETLADRAVRVVGRDKTVGTNWGGYGTFRDLLLGHLPDDIHLSDSAPYTVFDANRHISAAGLVTPQLAPPQAAVQPPVQAPAPRQPEAREPRYDARLDPRYDPRPAMRGDFDDMPAPAKQTFQAAPQRRLAQPLPPMAQPAASQQTAPNRNIDAPAPTQQSHEPMPRQPVYQQPAAQAEPRRETARAPQQPVPQQQAPVAPRTADQATQIQHSISRIHEACQAPALAPAEYRVLFDVMAQEITANGLQGAQTLVNVAQRAREFGLDLKRDDLRFILEVVSESDPWFEQGASASLFASRFRNFVVARCRSQGLSLSADELDLVEAWFSAQPPQQTRVNYGRPAQPQQAPAANTPPAAAPGSPAGERWWSLEEGRQHIAEQRSQGGYGAAETEDEFPRIVRTRLRG